MTKHLDQAALDLANDTSASTAAQATQETTTAVPPAPTFQAAAPDHPERYADEAGVEMWDRVMARLAARGR